MAASITYPTDLTVNQSAVISLTLSIIGTGVYAYPSVSADSPGQVVADATPVGTPGNSLLATFGPGYEPPYATANLAASSFTVASVDPAGEQRSLNVQSVQWSWNVTPNQSGTQHISIEVTFHWAPNVVGPVQAAQTYKVVSADFLVPVAAGNSKSPTVGPLDIYTIINGVVATVAATGLIGMITLISVLAGRRKRRPNDFQAKY